MFNMPYGRAGFTLVRTAIKQIKIFRLKEKENTSKFSHGAQVDIARAKHSINTLILSK